MYLEKLIWWSWNVYSRIAKESQICRSQTCLCESDIFEQVQSSSVLFTCPSFSDKQKSYILVVKYCNDVPTHKSWSTKCEVFIPTTTNSMNCSHEIGIIEEDRDRWFPLLGGSAWGRRESQQRWEASKLVWKRNATMSVATNESCDSTRDYYHHERFHWQPSASDCRFFLPVPSRGCWPRRHSNDSVI